MSNPSEGFLGSSCLGHLWGDTKFTACPQAALLLSLLWMPALLSVASRLLLLPRALLSMASGSPPPQSSPASDSGYVPGSVSAAFVTCPNEKVAKEIARWGLQCGERVILKGELGCQSDRPLLSACSSFGNPSLGWQCRGLATGRSEWGCLPPSGPWWRSAWQPASTSSLRLHPCESRELAVDLTRGAACALFPRGKKIPAPVTLFPRPSQLRVERKD